MTARTHSVRPARWLAALAALVTAVVVAGPATAAPARARGSSPCSVWIPIVGSIEVAHGTTITTPGGALIVCNNGHWTVVIRTRG